MSVLLSYDDVKKQSQAVWGQFGESKWLPYSQTNCRLPNRRDPEELRGCGIGKFAVLAAMGASVEDHVDLIREHRSKFDLITCDKGFGVLMDHGIKPDYVQLCDCNIPFKWIERWIEETGDVKLLATTYANVEWTTKWKGPIYLYVNKDALHSEEKFTPILGEQNFGKLGFPDGFVKANSQKVRVIPAGSNVSNAMLIFMLGVDETSREGFAGYEHFFLTGYDYSWRPSGPEAACKTGNYYAFGDPRPKRYYMGHRTLLDLNGDIVLTSENLLFSAKWLYSYITAYNLPVTNCSERGILDIPGRAKLADCLARMRSTPEAEDAVRRELAICRSAADVFRASQENLNRARRALWQ